VSFIHSRYSFTGCLIFGHLAGTNADNSSMLITCVYCQNVISFSIRAVHFFLLIAY